MHIAHVALWTRSLNAQVQFWETVFNGRSNERYVSKNRPGFESHFITLDDGPTIELMTLPELPDALQPTRASSMTPAIRQAMIRFIFNLSFRSQGEVFGVQ